MSFALVFGLHENKYYNWRSICEKKINNNNFNRLRLQRGVGVYSNFFPNYSFANLINVYIEQPILTSHPCITKRECPTSKKLPSVTTNY